MEYMQPEMTHFTGKVGFKGKTNRVYNAIINPFWKTASRRQVVLPAHVQPGMTCCERHKAEAAGSTKIHAQHEQKAQKDIGGED